MFGMSEYTIDDHAWEGIDVQTKEGEARGWGRKSSSYFGCLFVAKR